MFSRMIKIRFMLNALILVDHLQKQLQFL